LPTPLLSCQTPFERLYGQLPSYSHIRVFGCLAYATDVHVPHKFVPQAKRCIFLGYPVGQKAYKLYDLAIHQMFTSRDVVFHETIFPYESISSPSSNLDPVIPLSVSDPSPPVNNPHQRNQFLPSNNPHHRIQFLLSHHLLVLFPNQFYAIPKDLITLPRLYVIMSTTK
jgi:hypothetical protein